MNTTNKEFKVQVQEHIISCLSVDETNELKEQLQNVVNEFQNWYSPYEQKRTENKQDAFQEFLMCLPSCLSVEHVYYSSNEIMKHWFETVGMTYKQPKVYSKAHNTYLALVYREFRSLCKQFEVTI